MFVPYRPKALSKVRRRFKYIIIHDLNCMFEGVDQAKMDTPQSQVSHIRSYNWIVNGQPDVNYHFMVETIRKEPQTIMGRPLNKLCEYDDIPSQYDASIHIGIMGKYQIMKPDTRFYQQIHYRITSPLMTWFRIPQSNILFHSHISTNKELECPGNLFRYDTFMAQLMPMLSR